MCIVIMCKYFRYYSSITIAFNIELKHNNGLMRGEVLKTG